MLPSSHEQHQPLLLAEARNPSRSHELQQPLLLAEARNPSRSRITSVTACAQQGVMLCGNQDGSVLCFTLPEALLEMLQLHRSPNAGVLSTGSDVAVAGGLPPSGGLPSGGLELPVPLSVQSMFRSAHGSSVVSLLQPLPDGGGLISAGHDGSLRLYSSAPTLAAAGDSGIWGLPTLCGALSVRGVVPAISAVFTTRDADPPAAADSRRESPDKGVDAVSIITGFQGTEFVAYSSVHQAEVGAGVRAGRGAEGEDQGEGLVTSYR